MTSFSDIVIFHKNNQFYGMCTIGDWINKKETYVAYVSTNNLKASILEFTPTECDLSPVGKRLQKAIRTLLFSVEANLEDDLRKVIYRKVKSSYKDFYRTEVKIAKEIETILERNNQTSILDLSRITSVLFNNIENILRE